MSLLPVQLPGLAALVLAVLVVLVVPVPGLAALVLAVLVVLVPVVLAQAV